MDVNHNLKAGDSNRNSTSMDDSVTYVLTSVYPRDDIHKYVYKLKSFGYQIRDVEDTHGNITYYIDIKSQADLYKLMDIIDYPIVMYKNHDSWMVIEIYDDWRE